MAHLVCGLTFAVASRAGAQTAELPVVVSYVAPTECATADAFQQLVATQVAGESNSDRPLRFSVTIRREGDFIGTLKTEGGAREIHASSCDEVTAALATIIAMAQPQPSAAPPPPAPGAPVVPSIVPIPPTSPTPTRRNETRMASPTLFGVGIAMLTVGLAAIPFGVSHIVTADTATEACPAGATCQPRSADITGIAIVGASASLAVGGMVMSMLGLKRKHVSVAGGPMGSTGTTVMVTF